MMRTPNINVDSRVPTVNPTIAPRVDPNIAGRTNTIINTNVISVDRATPRITPRINPHLDDALCALLAEPLSGLRRRLSRCRRRMHGQPGRHGRRQLAATTRGGKQAKKGGNSVVRFAAERSRASPAIRNQFVAEIDGGLSNTQIEDLARRHGLALVEAQNFPLIGATIGLFRIAGNRPADEVRRSFATDASVKSLQFNLRYCAAGGEDDRGRSRPICGAQAQTAAGACDGARHECHDRRDRLRHRRQASRTRQHASPTVSMRWAARKARMCTAPALPAPSPPMRG